MEAHPHQTTPHPTTPLEAQLGFRLGRLARTLRAAWATELAELSLTPPQAAVLRGVANAEGSSVRALARRLGGDPMNVKRCVDELERRALVASTSDPEDRRPRLLSLTEDGRAAAVEVDRRSEGQEAMLTHLFTRAERSRFDATLTKLEAAAGIAHGGEPASGMNSSRHDHLDADHQPETTLSNGHSKRPADASGRRHQRQSKELG